MRFFAFATLVAFTGALSIVTDNDDLGAGLLSDAHPLAQTSAQPDKGTGAKGHWLDPGLGRLSPL